MANKKQRLALISKIDGSVFRTEIREFCKSMVERMHRECNGQETYQDGLLCLGMNWESDYNLLAKFLKAPGLEKQKKAGIHNGADTIVDPIFSQFFRE